MKVYDRRGNPAPTMTVSDLRKNIGRFWILADRRGAVGIKRSNETVAVALSLDQFVSILFGIQNRPPRKKHKLRENVSKKRHRSRE